MNEEISCRDVFAIYEKENPVAPEEPKKEETLFVIDEPEPAPIEQPAQLTPTPQEIKLPEGFEDILVEKILAKLSEKKEEQNG